MDSLSLLLFIETIKISETANYLNMEIQEQLDMDFAQ